MIKQFSHFVVTTSHKPYKHQVIYAKKLAEYLNSEYVKRRYLSHYIKEHKVDFYYVVEADLNVVIRWKDGELFFHPSVAKVRMKNLRNGGRDYLIEALELNGDEVILDATFGLGAEAILISAFLKNGCVVGLEKSRHIYAVVSLGLKKYSPNSEWIKNAMRRIYLINYDFKKYIRSVKDNSYDIVYCDPMFENPKYESSAMNPLRPFASYDTVDMEDVREMIRVARKRIVLKSHEEDSLFERLGVKFDRLLGSKRSGVIYGVIEKPCQSA